MASLTSSDTAHILLGIVQHIRQQTGAGPNFTLANLATLLAVCENPGALQPDIGAAVGGIDGATLTRHLNMLSGRGRDGSTSMPSLIRTDRNTANRRLNDVFLTDGGAKFAADLASIMTRQLQRVADR